MKSFSILRSLSGLLALIALSGCDASNSRRQGISVGNGNRPTDPPRAAMATYISPYRFRLSYSEALDLEKDETQKNVTISNRKLVDKGAPISSVKIEVVRRGEDYPGFAAQTAATGRHLDGLKTFLMQKHPEAELKRVDFPAAHGFAFATKGAERATKSYLLSGNLDLVILSLEAHAAGRGLDWVAPIVETFTGDAEPPYVTTVRLETAALTAGGRSRLVFRALDPSGISLVVPKAGIVIDRPGERSPEDRATPIEIENQFQSLGNDEYAVSFKVGPYAGKGTYLVKRLSVADKAGNVQALLPAEGAASLPLASFSVDNPAGDVTAPDFGRVSIDKALAVNAGEAVGIVLEVFDAGTGIATGDNAGCIVLGRSRARGTDAGERLCGSLAHLKENLYRLSVKTGPNWQTGSFDLNRLVVWDKAGNAGVFAPPKPGAEARFAPAAMTAGGPPAPGSLPKGITPQEAAAAQRPYSFAVGNEKGGDEQGPIVSQFQFEASVASVGTKAVATFEAKDVGSGVAPGEVRVVLGANQIDDELPLVTMRGKLEALGADQYRVELRLSPWILPGRYVVQEVSVPDVVGNPSVWKHGGVKVELMLK